MMSVQEAGDLLNSALEGKNKEEAVLNVIQNTDLERRLQICNYYAQTYGKSLYSELKSKLSGYFRPLGIHLFFTSNNIQSKIIKKRFKRLQCRRIHSLRSFNFSYTRRIKTN